jgi:6-phosphogluconolactonase
MTLLQWKNKEELELALCDEISAIVNSSIAQFGDARILLSGGSTPYGVYQKLSEADLDWSKVIVGMVDERMVESTSPDSNYGNLTKVFEHAIQEGALVMPMVMTKSDWTKNLFLVKETYETFMERIDFMLIGMGNDGHTASLFPDDSASEDDLNLDEITLLYTYAPSEPSLRMTCSKGMLSRARNTALMFTGASKMEIFERAEAENYPIHRLVSVTPNVKLYYTA